MVFATLCFLACRSQPAEQAPSAPPDILLVVMDTVRADALGSGGSGRASSPRSDALAARGVRFSDVTSPGSWTWPAHASLFTGTPPWEHGAHHHQGTDPDLVVSPMRADLPTVAEQLVAAGYRATALSANGWLHPDLGLTRGFQRVAVLDSDWLVLEEAARVIAQDADRPGPELLFVNFMGAHAPWTPSPAPWSAPLTERLEQDPPAWAAPYVVSEPTRLDLYRVPRGASQSGFQAYMTGQLDIPTSGLQLIEDLYEGSVDGVDHAVGRLLDVWLASHPDGVVVLTSDHGEYLGEHQQLEHGLTAWPEVLQVPLIIQAPGRLPAGVEVDTPVQLQDLAGTLVELAGLQPSTPSLLPVIQGQARPGPIMAAAWHHVVPATRMGGPFAKDWFLLRSDDEVLVLDSDGDTRLFDRAADPGLLRDLADEQPEHLATLQQRFADQLQAMQQPRQDAGPGLAAPTEGQLSGPAVAIPDAVQGQLKALGYIDAGTDGAAP